ACRHGDVMKAIRADAMALHLDEFQRIVADPASISVIRYTPTRPFLVRLNDTADLSGLVPPKRRTRRSGPAGQSGRAGGGGGGGGAAGGAPPPVGTGGAERRGGGGRGRRRRVKTLRDGRVTPAGARIAP